jgi:hypothetical protein
MAKKNNYTIPFHRIIILINPGIIRLRKESVNPAGLSVIYCPSEAKAGKITWYSKISFSVRELIKT